MGGCFVLEEGVWLQNVRQQGDPVAEKQERKGVFMSIRLTEALREQVREQARLNERTFAGQILYYIKKGLTT